MNDLSNIEYVRWQKERVKLERDVYLSLACIVSQVALVWVSNLTVKYNSYVEYKERENKIK